MATRVTYPVTLSFGSFVVTSDVSPGDPGRCSGPPESCRESEPPEVGTVEVLREDGSKVNPLGHWFDRMTNADLDADFEAACHAANAVWMEEDVKLVRELVRELEEEEAAWKDYEAHLNSKPREDRPETTPEEEKAADLAFDAARERAYFG